MAMAMPRLQGRCFALEQAEADMMAEQTILQAAVVEELVISASAMARRGAFPPLNHAPTDATVTGETGLMAGMATEEATGDMGVASDRASATAANTTVASFFLQTNVR